MYLVTGGLGFIGSNIVNLLHKKIVLDTCKISEKVKEVLMK